MLDLLYIDDLLLAGNLIKIFNQIETASWARSGTEYCREAKICLQIETPRGYLACRLAVGRVNYARKLLIALEW